MPARADRARPGGIGAVGEGTGREPLAIGLGGPWGQPGDGYSPWRAAGRRAAGIVACPVVGNAPGARITAGSAGGSARRGRGRGLSAATQPDGVFPVVLYARVEA